MKSKLHEFTLLKLWKGLGSPVIDVSVKKDILLVFFFGILVGRCGGTGERLGLERSWSEVRIRLSVAIFFLIFITETLSITGQTCLWQRPLTKGKFSGYAICGLSLLLVLFLAPKCFVSGYTVFPFPSKIPIRSGTNEHV